MIQYIIALTIVFLAVAYTLYALVKSIIGEKTSPCDGCTGCELRDKLAPGECKSHKTKGIKVRKLKVGITEIKKKI